MRKRVQPIVPTKLAARARRDLVARQGMLALGALASLHAPANAASQSAILSMSASVTAQCFIGNASLVFGTFGVFSASGFPLGFNTISANVGIPIACTSGSPGTIYASTNTAVLTGASTATQNTLVANLYKDGAFSSPFPMTLSSGVVYTGAGTSTNQTIYGQIVTNATTKSDSYTGTVVLTISY